MHDALAALTVRLTTRSRFSGMGGLEFKRNENTGTFVVIEPTVGRVDWQEEIATLSGVNIPMAAFLHATGQPVPSAGNDAAPVAWRTSFKHSAPEHLRKAGINIVDGYWRSTDPVPGLFFYGLEPIRRMINRGVAGANIYQVARPCDLARKSPLGG